MNNYPQPAILREQAQKLAASAQSISDASEYPRLALGAVNRQSDALNELAQAIEDNASAANTPKRSGMTGEERRERRAAILRIRAARLKVKAADLHRHSHDIGSRIPLGQPILVGHHSERGHRRAIDKMHNATGKAIQTDNYAEALQERAGRVAGNSAILNSDSDALTQLRHKLETLERSQEHMRQANKLVRKQDRAGLAALGFSEHQISQLFAPDFCGRLGFPDYALTNNSANMRRIKQRITDLEARAGKQDTKAELFGVRIEEDYSADRLRLYFPSKPPEAVRKDLKGHGFRWSPTEGAWQRQINGSSKFWAEALIKRHYAPKIAADPERERVLSWKNERPECRFELRPAGWYGSQGFDSTTLNDGQELYAIPLQAAPKAA